MGKEKTNTTTSWNWQSFALSRIPVEAQTQAEEPKRLQSLTLKVESDCLMTSHIGIIPDCEAGTAKPDPTATALSLNGLQDMQNK